MSLFPSVSSPFYSKPTSYWPGPTEGNENDWKPFLFCAITHPHFEALREKYQVWIRMTPKEQFSTRLLISSLIESLDFLQERTYWILLAILEMFDEWSAIQDANGACGFSSDLIIVTDCFKTDMSFALGAFDRLTCKMPSPRKYATATSQLRGDRRARRGSASNASATSPRTPRLATASTLGVGRASRIHRGDVPVRAGTAAAGRKSESVSPGVSRPGKKRRNASGSGDAEAGSVDSSPVNERFHDMIIRYISDIEDEVKGDKEDLCSPKRNQSKRASGRRSGSGSSSGSLLPPTPPFSGRSIGSGSGSGSDLMNISPIRHSTPTPSREEFAHAEDSNDKENVRPGLTRTRRVEEMSQMELEFDEAERFVREYL